MTQAPEGARAAFEAWATSRDYTLLRSQDAGYTNPSIAVAWQAYQAALASVASPAPAQAAEGWRAELIEKVKLLAQEESAYDEEGYCLNPDAAELRDDLIAALAVSPVAHPAAPTDAQIDKALKAIGNDAESIAKHWGLPTYDHPQRPVWRKILRDLFAVSPVEPPPPETQRRPVSDDGDGLLHNTVHVDAGPRRRATVVKREPPQAPAPSEGARNANS